ncbi:MAG TPA: class I adenylate-forming enzyme family protein [Candidatus Acidoferrales bacterium]|nr:class I adenylate-forming enzyme family protein [Candidatus Acidoferrales bacterium]
MPPIPCLPSTYLEAQDPTRTAVLDGDLSLTFGDLLARARAAARRLRGQRIALHLPNSWEYVVLELAVPLGGGIVVPLPMGLGPAEISWALERTKARLVEATEAADLCRPGPGGMAPPPADPDRVVEIALTSGTTGLPKLASLTAGLKQATFEGFTQRLQVTAADRVLPMTPLAQGIGGMCLYCLRRGASLVLQLAAAPQATVLVGVPTNLIRMLQEGEPPRLAARCTAVAGAPLPPDVARRWEERTGSRVVSFYGSMDAGQLAVGSPDDPAEKRWNTVGRPHDSCRILITPEGEICMRGPTVQPRYWGEETGPFAKDGWAHMGDLGFLDQDGYLHVTGRANDILIRGGTNINPYEVEAELRQHPAVADVCVVGRPDPELGERVMAFVVARGALRLEDLRSHLERRGLARYKWPEHLELLAEIPLRGPGKVDRRALRERAGAGALR